MIYYEIWLYDFDRNGKIETRSGFEISSIIPLNPSDLHDLCEEYRKKYGFQFADYKIKSRPQDIPYYYKDIV